VSFKGRIKHDEKQGNEVKSITVGIVVFNLGKCTVSRYYERAKVAVSYRNG
jgi:hypothetical protein